MENIYESYKKFCGGDRSEKLIKKIKEDKEYINFFPHHDFIENIPDFVVLDFFNFIVNHYGFEEAENEDWTLSLVKTSIVEYLFNLYVMDTDLRRILDYGWSNNFLKNSRDAIYDIMTDILDEEDI